MRDKIHRSGSAGRAPNSVQEASLVLTANSGFTGIRATDEPVAVGMADDRICWVAHPDAVGTASAPVAARAQVRRFAEGFLMPGFHDAHLHFFHAALYDSPLAASFVGASETDCVERLRRFATTRPRGSWLLAQGWREYLWDPPQTPSRHSLDAAFPDRPVALYSGDAHTLWLNSRALDQLGITAASTPPAGGAYDHDAEGELTGIVRETAAMELTARIVDAFTREELLGAYEAFQSKLNALGVTSVCDMALTATTGLDFVRDDLFCALEETGRLTLRTHLFPTLTRDARRLEELQARLTGPLLRPCGCKQFFDGVSSQHTAWLAEPYANARTPGEVGRPTLDPTLMEELVSAAVGAGRMVRIHTIGDEAIHQALNIYERACEDLGEDLGEGTGESAGPGSIQKGRLVLEHLENFQPEDIARLAKLGVVASVQPRHLTLDPGGPERDLGPERVPWMWPLRQLLDAGAVLAFGTDAPVVDPDPLRGVYTALTRQDADTREPKGGWLPQERITAAEALRAYTWGSAYACGRESELGRLAPGMLADIAVFDRDLLHASPEELLDARAQAVFVGGRQVK